MPVLLSTSQAEAERASGFSVDSGLLSTTVLGQIRALSRSESVLMRFQWKIENTAQLIFLPLSLCVGKVQF